MFAWIQSGLDSGGNNTETISAVNCHCARISLTMIRSPLLRREVYKEARLGIKQPGFIAKSTETKPVRIV